MAQIPDQSGVPQVSATPTAPNDYQNIRSSPEDFGAAVAQGTQKLGQGIDKASQDMTNVLVSKQNRQNAIGVDDQLSQFQRQILYKTFGGDPANPQAQGLYQLHGKAAMEAGPGVASGISDLRDSISKQLNPAQKLMFDEQSNRMVMYTQQEIGRHIDAQQDAYGVASNKSVMDAATQAASLQYNSDQSINDNIERGKQASFRNVQIGGNHGDPDIVNSALTNATTTVVRGAIDGALAHNDYVTAQHILDKWGPQLQPASRAELAAHLRPLADTDFVDGAIDDAVNGRPIANPANNVGNIRTTGIPWQDKGKPYSGFETFSSPEAGVKAATQNIISHAQQNGGSINLNDLIAGNGRVKGWAPASDNNNPTAYAQRIGRETGIDPNAPLPLNDPAAMANVVKSMNGIEKGNTPFSDDVYHRGASAAINGQPGGLPAPGAARAAAIPDRYLTDMDKIQNVMQQTKGMEPRIRQRIIDGTMEHLQKMNSLENQAESQADKHLSNNQRDNNAILFGSTLGGQNISDSDLANYVRNQQITPEAAKAIKQQQISTAEGKDEPLQTAVLWGKVSTGDATQNDIWGALAAGYIRGTTANEMIKAQATHAKTNVDQVERGSYEALRSTLNGKAIESGGIDLFGANAKAAAQLWAQAQQEWSRRVVVGKEPAQDVLNDMLPRYEKSMPETPNALPNPRYGIIGNSEDVKAVAQKTKDARAAGEISQDTYNSEGALLQKYLLFYQNKEQRKANLKASSSPMSKTKTAPLAPSDNQ